MLTWTAPAALWLLAAVPLVWLALAVARTNFDRASGGCRRACGR